MPEALNSEVKQPAPSGRLLPLVQRLRDGHIDIPCESEVLMEDAAAAITDLQALAHSLMRTCYDEANRLASHGGNGLEKLVMSQLYDAANAAEAKLDDQTQQLGGGK